MVFHLGRKGLGRYNVIATVSQALQIIHYFLEIVIWLFKGAVVLIVFEDFERCKHMTVLAISVNQVPHPIGYENCDNLLLILTFAGWPRCKIVLMRKVSGHEFKKKTNKKQTN